MSKAEKLGVILVNLGTPESPTPEAIKTYLTEFLLDHHVVDLPAIIWSPLLRYIILPKRAPKTANNYAKIWMKEGSPLLIYSQNLAKLVSDKLSHINVQLAMTYGQPDLQQALNRLSHCNDIKIIPLFPQYSTTTTLAVLNKIRKIIRDWHHKPSINYIDDYAEHPLYIQALVNHIESSFKLHGQPDTLILSYHGIPVSYIKKRKDDYVNRCTLTTTAVSKLLHQRHIQTNITQTFQSRFGKGEWTTPDTTEKLKQLANNGHKHIQVICPGFAVDCIETLEEIAQFNQEQFLHAGGELFHYIPALNDSSDQINLMCNLITESKVHQL